MHTNISLQQLRYIIEVAECGSINAASQQLYVSQPTLSTTIKDTEQELGISIFNRTNRGITLTNEGTEFIGYARQILQQFDLFERVIPTRTVPPRVGFVFLPSITPSASMHLSIWLRNATKRSITFPCVRRAQRK